MKVRQIKEIIADLSDDTDMFACVLDRAEADDYVEETLEKTKLSDDEYLELLRRMETDDGVWQEIFNAWRYHMQDLMEKREKGKVDVNSK